MKSNIIRNDLINYVQVERERACTCVIDTCDTLQHDHPYISAMVNNGSIHYDHDRDGTHSQVSGCTVSEFRVRNKCPAAI